MKKEEFSLAERSLSSITRLAAAATGTIAVIYIAGWNYKSAYLEVFGATWLLHLYPNSEFIKLAWPALYWGLYYLFQESRDAHNEPTYLSEAGFRKNCYMILGAGLLCELLFAFLLPKFPSLSDYRVFPHITFLLLCLTVYFPALQWKLFSWNLPSVILGITMAALSLYAIPQAQGKNAGLRDSAVKTSKLAYVRENVRVSRLLLNDHGTLYCVLLSSSSSPSGVYAVPADTTLFVSDAPVILGAIQAQFTEKQPFVRLRNSGKR